MEYNEMFNMKFKTNVRNKIIIGISGNKNAGKDTFAKMVAKYLIENTKLTVGFYKVVYPLKKILIDIFYIPESVIEDPILKEKIDEFYDITPRRLMQLIGTEMFRKVYDENVWVMLADKNIERMKEDVIIITDVRFENEMYYIREVLEVSNYTELVYIDRFKTNRFKEFLLNNKFIYKLLRKFGMLNDPMYHESEMIDKNSHYMTYHVDNTRCLKVLNLEAEIFAENLIKKLKQIPKYNKKLKNEIDVEEVRKQVSNFLNEIDKAHKQAVNSKLKFLSIPIT